ncbi:MAG: hypothetical protein KAV87_54465 [Desulfobacteraceae bacterium]|nr:hypothetical protein [Desulfobacteraceae bacterium]
MQLVELFAKSGNRPPEKSSWYAAYLLDPFTKTAEAPCLAHHLVTAKMYHKNRNNFRAFMLISDAAGFENVKKGVEKMTTTVSYHVSIPEAFEDYTEFQTDLDDFLLGVGEFVDEPPMLGTYIRSAGFTLERSIYSKL